MAEVWGSQFKKKKRVGEGVAVNENVQLVRQRRRAAAGFWPQLLCDSCRCLSGALARPVASWVGCGKSLRWLQLCVQCII